MSKRPGPWIVLGIALCFPMAGCAGPELAPIYVDSLTGTSCSPDLTTWVAESDAPETHRHGHHGKGPTGLPGDNRDDDHSGKIDCVGDGDSGQGNDSPDCEAPDDTPPGCDALGCCAEWPDD